MYLTFKATMCPEWTLTDDGVIFKGTLYRFNEMSTFTEGNVPNSSLTNGVIQVGINGKAMPLTLAYPFKQKAEAMQAIAFIKEHYGDASIQMRNKEKAEKINEGLIYDLQGVRGRHMRVYEDRAVLSVKAGLGSFVTGNFSDGEKTIYYTDCIGVQFKESGFQIGYLQLETASRLMNNSQDNFFNENSFTFDTTVQSNEKMNEVADYIRSRVSECKNGPKQQTVVQEVSAADEIIKFKNLLDMGIITQEEFDAKKKQLLGL